MDPYKKENAEE